MTADGEDTSRTQVRTYVPAYQKSEWESHADELDMSQSEFVRTMVQAGRTRFGSCRGRRRGASTPLFDTLGRRFGLLPET